MTRAEIPDEAALSRLMTNGAKAWRTVPDAAAWVDELRGNTMSDTTDQYQALRDALAALKCGKLQAHSGHVIADESDDWCSIDVNCNAGANKIVGRLLARAIVAAVNASPALLAEVERLTAELAAANARIQSILRQSERREAELRSYIPNGRTA